MTRSGSRQFVSSAVTTGLEKGSHLGYIVGPVPLLMRTTPLLSSRRRPPAVWEEVEAIKEEMDSAAASSPTAAGCLWDQGKRQMNGEFRWWGKTAGAGSRRAVARDRAAAEHRLASREAGC
jgi:hypothetical protein